MKYGLRKCDLSKTVWLPRPDKVMEAKLDRAMVRRRPWERRWVPAPRTRADEHWARGITLTLPEDVVLVGKGPSLDGYIWHPSKTYVCINETVCMCPWPALGTYYDRRVGEYLLTHDCVAPTYGFLSPLQVRDQKLPGPRLLFQPSLTRLGEDGHPPHAWATAACTLFYLARWGVKRVGLVGFDSFWNEGNSYAESVGYANSPRNDYKRTNSHIAQVLLTFRLSAYKEK